MFLKVLIQMSDECVADTEQSENEVLKLLCETVGNITDSFTLLRTIDTELTETYEKSLEELPSGDYQKIQVKSYLYPMMKKKKSLLMNTSPWLFSQKKVLPQV